MYGLMCGCVDEYVGRWVVSQVGGQVGGWVLYEWVGGQVGMGNQGQASNSIQTWTTRICSTGT